MNQIKDIDKLLPSLVQIPSHQMHDFSSFLVRIDHYRTAMAQSGHMNDKFRSMTLIESVNSNFLRFKMGSMTFWLCLVLVFWMNMQRYWKWSVSLFSTACYTSKIKAEISMFVIPEGRMILPRFLAANIPDIPPTLPVT